jgi:hypothetical protein
VKKYGKTALSLHAYFTLSRKVRKFIHLNEENEKLAKHTIRVAVLAIVLRSGCPKQFESTRK